MKGALASILCSCLASSMGLVIPPTTLSNEALTRAIILAPALYDGASVDPSEYKALATAIQSSYGGNLWVGIMEYENKESKSFEINAFDTQAMMYTHGLPADAEVFLASHGPTASKLMSTFIQENKSALDSTKGFILLGSFLDQSEIKSLADVPTLSIGGGLDGISHASKLAQAHHFSQQVANSQYSVVSVPGVSHAQFASGTLPPSVKGDLKSSKALSSAHEDVASTINHFITTNEEGLNNLKLSTLEVAQPILDALKFEGGRGYGVPCWDNEKTPIPGCIDSSPFAMYIQQVLAGDLKIIATDKMYQTERFYPHDYVPKVNMDTNGDVHTLTVTEHVYLDGPNTPYLSASEISIKMVSRQSIKKAYAKPYGDYDVEDSKSTCGELNEHTYNEALKAVPADILTRFQADGIPLVMITPEPFNLVEPLWYNTRLTFAPVENGAKMGVTSSTFGLGVSVPLIGGVHHCKLLSPARAMEWIYTEGLRPKLSADATTTELIMSGKPKDSAINISAFNEPAPADNSNNASLLMSGNVAMVCAAVAGVAVVLVIVYNRRGRNPMLQVKNEKVYNALV